MTRVKDNGRMTGMVPKKSPQFEHQYAIPPLTLSWRAPDQRQSDKGVGIDLHR